MKNILELLEQSARKHPDKSAFIDENVIMSYEMLLRTSMSIGTSLLNLGVRNRPIAVYLEKSVDLVSAMMGVVYSGNFYTVIDTDMPSDRIEKIFSTLKPAAVITDMSRLYKAINLSVATVFSVNDLSSSVPDNKKLKSIRSAQIDTDPVYCLYTSGSTGVPKGTILTHRNVLAYSEWVVNEFSFDERTVFANQTPFYFSMSVTDIFSTLRVGATLVMIPKQYFSFPIQLVELMNRHYVNTIYWVPSAISIVANMKVFDYLKPLYLKKVLFAGEVMPAKQLNYWIDSLGDEVIFANLFGPTEATDICTYYTLKRRFRDDEPLPIGSACDNCDVFIIDDNGLESNEGELYIRGSFLASGYYNNPDKTAEAFVQNPINEAYPEICYKTGDLVKLNEAGELMYLGRKDFQIKRMGYRIELGEIETAACSFEGVKECACVYKADSDNLVLFYSADKLDDNELMDRLKRKLNDYMIPNRLVKLSVLPHNPNGKIDRLALKNSI